MPETEKKFRNMNLEERYNYLRNNSPISEEGINTLRNWKDAKIPQAENHITYMPFPAGVVKIMVNNVIRGAPVVTEEPSVVAAASNGAKMAEAMGGFRTTVTGTETMGQIQIIGIPIYKMENAARKVSEASEMLLKTANAATPHLVEAGGGVLSLRTKILDTSIGPQLIVDFDVECMDAMGANAVSKMAEAMAGPLTAITGGEVVGRILSNLHTGRIVTCEAKFDKNMLQLRKEINGETVEISAERMIDRIIALSEWASNDQFRATTHNKGIMNGIDAVAAALGQDTRAIEAAAHSYAAFGRKYSPLSYFEKIGDNLYGCLTVPIPVGFIGGAINTNPTVKALLEMTGCRNSRELASLIAAVGLAQNISALRMLAGEGITNGHLPLHLKRTAQQLT